MVFFKVSFHNKCDLKSNKNEIGEGNGNPLLYSCLGNPMEKGSWCG